MPEVSCITPNAFSKFALQITPHLYSIIHDLRSPVFPPPAWMRGGKLGNTTPILKYSFLWALEDFSNFCTISVLPAIAFFFKGLVYEGLFYDGSIIL